MKKFLKRYKHLTSLIAFTMLAFMLLPFGPAVIALALYQLANFAMSKPRRGYCYEMAGLTREQIDEFDDILRSCKAEFPKVKGLEEKLGSLAKLYDDMNAQLR